MNKNISKLSSAIIKPNYDRSHLSPGIVHIGLGNFHRAHQAWYLHRLMQEGKAQDWAIIGAGVRGNDEIMRQKLEAQDYCTSLIELSPESCSAEVTGSMIGFVPVEADNAALIAQMADPAIRIVSLTVTEGGYFIDPATQGFDQNHKDIQHDAQNPDQPRTAFGAMIAALKLRKSRGLPAFTCQSCDNLQGNGDVLRQTVISLAKMQDAKLADWIEQHSSFPNSMVDCIVPATGPKELALAMELGIDDQAPVTHENFRQWVIEDQFCSGRPAWEDVGAIITPLVHDYEKMKIRILNGGHQVIAAIGDLLGIETISGAMNHPLIREFFYQVEAREIVPHVHPVPDQSPEAYLELIAQRFSNPAIVDTTRRVAFDGSSRQPGFILPSVYDCLNAQISPSGLALVSAIWARYCLGVREDGSLIEENDPYWADLKILAERAKSDPMEWLSHSVVYGNLKDHEDFAPLFAHWLSLIYERGVEASVKTYLEA